MASVAKREWTYKGETKTAWVVRYKDDGKHRSKQYDKKKDAELFRRKVEREIEDGTHVAASIATSLRDVCDEFLRHSEDRMRFGGIGRYRYQALSIHINKSILPHLGQYKISELHQNKIEDWIKRIVREDGLAVSTAGDRFRTLRSIENYAMTRGLIKRRFTDAAAATLKGQKRPKIRTFDVEQISRLLSTVENRASHKHRSSELLTCYVHLAAFCGLRLGEINGLTIENVDLKARVVRVRHSLTAWDELKGPKTEAGVRDVPLPLHLAGLLREWVARRYVPNARNLLFRTPAGGRIDNGNLSAMWRGLLDRAGLLAEGEGFHFHALRHFAASWMIENRLGLTEVASLLGHEKFDMTLQVYAHPIVGGHARHQAMDAMSGALLSLSAAPIAQELRNAP